MNWRRLLHRAADAVHTRIGPRVAQWPALERPWVRLLDAIVAQQSDRVYFRRAILPAVLGAGFARVLFVGVRGYTTAYGAAFRDTKSEYWTADIDPAAAVHGEPGRHVTCNVRDLDRAFPPAHFDLVMINGVLGWGCDGDADMNRAIEAAHTVLRPRGWLLLGWNSDRIDDPRTLSAIEALFAPESFAGLPQGKTFPGATHVYGWFRAR